MKQKSLTDVCVISEDTVFINRVKIFSQNSNISFEYYDAYHCKYTTSIYLIDINYLEVFLKNIPKFDTLKFIVHGKQKDIAISFNAGCTDFLKDPWDNNELEARIYKILGSLKEFTLWDKLILSQTTISTNDFSLPINIEEHIILKKLLDNQGDPVPREALLFALWGNYKNKSRIVDMHIAKLRKKIQLLKKYDNTCCGTIKTIRSYGYMVI